MVVSFLIFGLFMSRIRLFETVGHEIAIGKSVEIFNFPDCPGKLDVLEFYYFKTVEVLVAAVTLEYIARCSGFKKGTSAMRTEFSCFHTVMRRIGFKVVFCHLRQFSEIRAWYRKISLTFRL